MKARILLLPGDGIGPEVTAAARSVLEKIAADGHHDFSFSRAPIGGEAMDACGTPLPEATLDEVAKADAVLLGAIGGPQWEDHPSGRRPEEGLLGLRKAMGVFANLRPVKVHPALFEVSPLKTRYLQGVDLLVVRELTGGIYFGKKSRQEASASDECVYTAAEIERIARVAAEMARKRSGRLVSVDKANVLETSRLWRSTVSRVVETEFPDVALAHMLVDAAAMHLLRQPNAFDVIVTENMFGDILTDEASMLSGSLGMLPSASLGSMGPGLFEPVHGSAPDIAGQGIANPFGAISSASMLLRQGLGLANEATAVENAVAAVIAGGFGTPDLVTGSSSRDTETITAMVCQNLDDYKEAIAYENLAMNISALGC